MRGRAPKGGETFLARAVARGEHTQEYHRLYATLTGAAQGQPWDAPAKIAARVDAATPRQALMLALALLVCE